MGFCGFRKSYVGVNIGLVLGSHGVHRHGRVWHRFVETGLAVVCCRRRRVLL